MQSNLPRLSEEDRILGYDLARALAVFGMVIVNFKIVMGAGEKGPAWLATLAGLLDGRAAATFVVLAGAGISLLSRRARMSGNRARLSQDRGTLWKRALFLFVLGSLYTPVWPADILHFYGVYIAAAAFLLSAPTKRLLGCAAALIAAFCALMFLFDYEKGWDWSTLSYAVLWAPAGMVGHIFFNGFHPVVPWLAFLLLGMILGRQDMRSPAVRRRVFVWGVGVAVAAAFGTGPMPPMPLYMLAGGGPPAP